MNILINALSGIGDALMFSPALKLLKEELPNYNIDMLVMYQSVSDLYHNSPYLRDLYLVEFFKQSKYKSLKEILAIRKNDYFISINVYPSNRIEYNLLNFFLGAKKRIGNSYIKTNFFRGEFLNNIKCNEVRNLHNVLQNINLLRNIIDVDDKIVSNLEITTTDDEENESKLWLQKNYIDTSRPIVGFHCGSSVLKNHINKRWDKFKYAALGNRLIQDYDAQILLFGNESELNLDINRLMLNKGFIASTSDFMDSMARLKHCDLFVSNDTAFLHCAAAFNIPTVALFGYTNYKELHPWKTKHIIIRKELECSPCFYNSPAPVKCKWHNENKFKCMKDINVDEVYDACKLLLVPEIPSD